MSTRLILMHAMMLMGMAASASNETTVIIVNNGKSQRQEVVAIDTTRMALPLSGGLTVRNAFGQVVGHQISYDGKLLIDASVQPFGKAVYTIEAGKPAEEPIVYAWGRQYDFRKDDIAWENDRIGFRVYGPKFQSDGDIGYGIDVWLKNTPDLVLEMFYRDNCFNKKSFHQDHGYGLDCYNVGPSLGCGTPALMESGQQVFPYCYDTYEILDNGPLRFTVRLDFKPTTVGKDNGVVEHRIISLDKGSNFCRMTVWYDNLHHPADLAAGIVLHDTSRDLEIGKNHVLYADPTGAPEKHNFQIFTGVLFPEGGFKTCRQIYKEQQKGIYGHALGIKKGYTSGRVTYYFGAAWSKYDVRTFAEWQLRAREFMSSLAAPLLIEVKAGDVSR